MKIGRRDFVKASVAVGALGSTGGIMIPGFKKAKLLREQWEKA